MNDYEPRYKQIELNLEWEWDNALMSVYYREWLKNTYFPFNLANDGM